MKQAINSESNLREVYKRNHRCLLDTSFILTCVKQKIDFFEDIKIMGIQILIPEQVIKELKALKNTISELSLKILDKNPNSFKKIDLGRGDVDKLIIKFAEQDLKIIVATLDREIKKKLMNPKLIIRGKKKLEII